MNEPVIIIACSKNQFDVIAYHRDICEKLNRKPECIIPRGYEYEKLKGIENGTILLAECWDKHLNKDQRDAWCHLIQTRLGRGNLQVVKLDM